MMFSIYLKHNICSSVVQPFKNQWGYLNVLGLSEVYNKHIKWATTQFTLAFFVTWKILNYAKSPIDIEIQPEVRTILEINTSKIFVLRPQTYFVIPVQCDTHNVDISIGLNLNIKCHIIISKFSITWMRKHCIQYNLMNLSGFKVIEKWGFVILSLIHWCSVDVVKLWQLPTKYFSEWWSVMHLVNFGQSTMQMNPLFRGSLSNNCVGVACN